MKSNLPCSSITFVDCLQTTVAYQPGDFLVIADNRLFSKLIRFGQHLRFRGDTNTKWTHAALIINSQGDLIEATGLGVIQSNIAKYTPLEYLLVSPDATDADREEMIFFALSCVGEKYGWLTILSICFSLLTGLKLTSYYQGQQICSGLVAKALERTSAIFPVDANNIPPCQLADFYLKSNLARAMS